MSTENSSVAQLLAELKSPKYDVRRRARLGLLKRGPESIASLVAGLGHHRLKRPSSEILSQLGNVAVPAVAALKEGLVDADALVRLNCARALGSVGGAAHAAVPALVVALEDEENYVRCAAAEALGKIGVRTRFVVDGLLTAARDDDEETVQAAVQSLRQLGGK